MKCGKIKIAFSLLQGRRHVLKVAGGGGGGGIEPKSIKKISATMVGRGNCFNVGRLNWQKKSVGAGGGGAWHHPPPPPTVIAGPVLLRFFVLYYFSQFY